MLANYSTRPGSFLRAFGRATHFMFEQRDQAKSILRKYAKIDDPGMDAVSMKEAAEVQKSFILGAGAPAQELGKMTMERWGTLVNQLYDLKLIKTKPVADKLFQNF